MKYMKQFGIILVITFLGEVLRFFIPLQIPASIYGMVLMLAALVTKILPLEAVRDTAMFLVEIMPMLFIPVVVEIMTAWGMIKEIWIPITIITLVSTVLVMVVSGRTTQFVIRFGNKKEERNEGTSM